MLKATAVGLFFARVVEIETFNGAIDIDLPICLTLCRKTKYSFLATSSISRKVCSSAAQHPLRYCKSYKWYCKLYPYTMSYIHGSAVVTIEDVTAW